MDTGSPHVSRSTGSAAASLSGWLLILGGMAMLAIAVLTPQWIENHRLAWERDLMQLQAQTLEQQAERYDHFLKAVEFGDPAVLRRLALAHLRMSPDEMKLLESPAGTTEPSTDRDAADLAGSAALEDWLSLPTPVVGRDVAPFEEPDTRLVRLATGWYRLPLVLAGAVCLMVGLMPQRPSEPA